MVFLTVVNMARLVKNRGPDQFWKKQMRLRLAMKFYGRHRNCTNMSINFIRRALRYSSYARTLKKSDSKWLFETRLTAAVREHQMEFEPFMEGLSQANIALDRKVLEDLSIYEPRTFQTLVEFVKKRNEEVGLSDAIKPDPTGIVTKSMVIRNKGLRLKKDE